METAAAVAALSTGKINTAMVDDDLYRQFRQWFDKDTRDDAEFEGTMADDALSWAARNRCLDAMLTLPQTAMSVREFLAIRHIPVSTLPAFRDRRRVGGDDDRGFSLALNEEMAQRAQIRSEGEATRPQAEGEWRDPGPLTPPLKKKDS